MAQQAKRGFLPTDAREFGADSLPKLRKAAEEVYYLLNRGYPVSSVTRFVGDRYQFSERQRLALARTVSPEAQILARKQRMVMHAEGETLYIDGFNVIISLEIAFLQSMLFRCMDGTIRDLAGLHGTYRMIPQTDQAVTALLETLRELKLHRAVIYLDRPVSNSGRLKQRILALAEHAGVETEVLIEEQVDTILKTKPLIASGDAIILDACSGWINLTKVVIERRIGRYDYVEIMPELV